jgi:L-rhamnose mutarotase
VERVCFLARVRPERLAEYRERHKRVWPQMRDGLLVGYLETENYQAAREAMAKTEVNERWQAEMSEFFITDGPPDESFTRIAEVFHLD